MITLRGTGYYDFVTTDSDITITEDGMIDAFGALVIAGLNSLGGMGETLAEAVEPLPIIGKDVAAGVSSAVSAPLASLTAPEEGVREYLTSKNITVLTVASWESLLNQTINDVIEVSFDPAEITETVSFHAHGGLGCDEDIVSLDVSGDLDLSAGIDFDAITFGVNLEDGPYLAEGGSLIVGMSDNITVSGNAHLGIAR